MSAVSGNTATATATQGASASDAVMQAVNLSDAEQIENTFLTLLTAQISNQDPTNPLDSTQVMNQFAAMSQVRSMENLSALTRNNMILLDNLQMLTAAGLVGQEVTVAAETVQIGDAAFGGMIDQGFASGQTTLRLTSASGVVSEVKLGGQAPGAVAFEIDPLALGLASGSYQVEALTDGGEFPAVRVAGRVDKVMVSQGGPVLQVQGVGAVPFYQIAAFGHSGG